MKKNYLAQTTFLFVAFLCSFNALAQTPSQDGEWGAPIPFGIVPVAVANLPDGNLITWSSQAKLTWVPSGSGVTYTQLFNPFTNTTQPETTTQTDHDMFCPGINNLSDGRILSAGGTSSQRTSIYDPVTEVWSRAADMSVPRGYQGNVTLSDGSVFTIGGSWEVGPDGNKDAELWTEETGWVMLPGIKGEDIYTSNDLVKEIQGLYRVDNHVWLWPAPNGELFHAGPGEMMHWIDVDNGGSITDAGLRGSDTYSIKGTTVMFDTGKILKVGGAESYGESDSPHVPAKDNSFVIDINNPANVTVTATSNNLAFARTMHNSTVLPDGKVLVTGGLDHAEVFTDVGSRLTAELFDPQTNSWSAVAGMVTPRTYHSVAILMLDGRVFVGGGGLCDNTNLDECVNHTDAEIYSPPYLFDGAGNLATRPQITNAPSTAAYNSNITVSADSGIQEFSLIRFSAATHSTNNEQRRIPVSFTGNGTYSVSIPGRELLPPGYYMLFALDANGVPSVAEAIQIGNTIPLNSNPSLILDLKFDDATGSTITDDSQYANDAVIYDVSSAGATKVPSTDNWGAGLFGGALETDGFKFQSETTAEIQHTTSMATADRFITVMAWVSRDEIVNNASIFAHDYANMFFGFHNSLYKWEFDTDQGSRASCYAGYSPTTEWVHMAASYDGKTARLYANGVEICAKNATGNILFTPTDPEPNFTTFSTSGFYERRTAAQIGEPYNGSGVTDELDGRIDELKVYNKALSEAEIKAFFDLGQGLPNVPVCPTGTIVAEYKVGAGGTWVQGNNINASEGSEIFIRAKDYVGDYLVTTPEIDGNTFSSASDFSQSNGYQLDIGTNLGNNDGLIAFGNAGQYVLTTPGGCPTAITLKVTGTCDPGDAPIATEFRVNGDWNSIYNGENDIELTAGTELVISASPNVNPNSGYNFVIVITLPDGSEVGDNYNLGTLSNLHTGAYIITTEEGCTQLVNLTVVPQDCAALNVMTEYRINQEAWAIGDSTPIEVDEGSQLALSIAPENLIYSISGPNGFSQTNLNENYVITEITSDNDGVYVFTTAGGCSASLEVNVNASNCSQVESEYRINTGQWMVGETEVSVQEGAQLMLSIAPNTIPYTITGPNGLFVEQSLGDYTIPSLGQEHDGTFTFETLTGCTVTLDVSVDAIDCNAVFTEYRINDEAWVESATEVTVDEGVHLMLSIEPDDAPYTIMLPSGAVENVAANMDFTIPNVDQTHNGDFLFTAQNGCEKTLTVTVAPVDCSTVVSEYRIGTTPWVAAATEVTVDEGEQLLLSLFPNNLPYTITDPSGAVINIGSTGLDNYTIEIIAQSDAGIYLFTTVGTGCSVSLNVNVNNPACAALDLRPEYSVDGAAFVEGFNGQNVALDEGVSLVLSALPNEDNGTPIPITITLPNGNEVADGYEIASLSATDEGSYLFTTDTGCTTSLNITVNSSSIDCTALNLVPEYSLNGEAFQASTNGGTLTIEQGDALILSASPDDFNGSPVSVNIVLPDTSMQSDMYEIALATPANNGTYTFTSDTGCTTTLELVVTPSGIDCAAVDLVPEYTVNGGTAQAGTNGQTLNLNLDDAIILSALPDDYNGEPVNIISITLPNGSTEDDGYEITSLVSADSGTYTFTTDTGCTATLILVIGEGDECTPNSVTPEYVINEQTTQSGGESIVVTVGNSLVLRIIQDDVFTITLPDGSEVSGEYTIDSVQMSQAGVYTFTTEQGCSTQFTISVILEEVDAQALKDMIVYPNPVRDGMLRFALENYMGQEIRVQIDDIYGKTILRKIFRSTHQADEVIDISIMSEGIYIVILTRNTDSEVAFKKVIKLGGL